MLISSGKWAIRFLLLCLLMTPLNTVLGWRGAIKLRKPAGLWAFGFAVAHFVLNVIGLQENWVRPASRLHRGTGRHRLEHLDADGGHVDALGHETPGQPEVRRGVRRESVS